VGAAVCGQCWLLFSEHPRDGNLGGPPQQLIAGDNMRSCDSRLSQSWRLNAVASSAGSFGRVLYYSAPLLIVGRRCK
jgi:hypothetical protein